MFLFFDVHFLKAQDFQFKCKIITDPYKEDRSGGFYE